jgi:hypothetical protein
MIEVNIDYNNLSAARKAKTELVKINISNHPDFPAGTTWSITIPKHLYDLLTA